MTQEFETAFDHSHSYHKRGNGFVSSVIALVSQTNPNPHLISMAMEQGDLNNTTVPISRNQDSPGNPF